MEQVRRKGDKAFTLLEVVIASGILAIVFLGAVTGMIFVARMSQAAQQDLMAMEVLDRESELIRATPSYAALGRGGVVLPAHVVYNTEIYPDLSFREPRVIPYDPNFPGAGPIFTIEYTWYGFGTVTSGTANSIRFYQDDWPDGPGSNGGELFTGSYVILREGVGAGQMAQITSHAVSGEAGGERLGEFELTAAFNGYTESNLQIAPASGTMFEVDGGKWVRITARWRPTPNEAERVVERSLFVSNR